MNELPKEDASVKEPSGYTRPADAPKAFPEPLSWRDWAAPLLGLGLGWLYIAVFSFDNIVNSRYGPGIGVTAFVFAFFAAVFVILGKRAFQSRPGLLFMAAALALALSCGIHAHTGLMILNCFLILAVSAAAAFQLSGHAAYSWRDVKLLPETIALSFRALFSRLGRPFQALGLLKKNKNSGLGAVLLGLLIAIPVLAVVLSLLISADAVFENLFDSLARNLSELYLGNSLWKLCRILVLALLVCSGLHFIAAPTPELSEKEPPESRLSALPFLAVTLLLDLVYILFVAIQFTHLFGGREAAAMAGGWAEYARTGFFQLVAVALINLCVCLLPAGEARFASRGGKVLRMADAVMIVLSFVILASAWWRMHLYIRAFGLSVLRILTLWGMIVIAVLLCAAAWKLWRPKFRFFQVLLAFALSTWCLFSLLGPSRLVADYNVDAYLDGKLSSVDISYLSSPDALPALYRLAEEEPDYEALSGKIAEMERQCDPQSGYDWHWSHWHASFLNRADDP